MKRISSMRLDFGEMPLAGTKGLGYRRGLRIAASSGLRGPRLRLGYGGQAETYRILDLKRRRAQIRARRELGLV
jgi:hypothetical protein